MPVENPPLGSQFSREQKEFRNSKFACFTNRQPALNNRPKNSPARA